MISPARSADFPPLAIPHARVVQSGIVRSAYRRFTPWCENAAKWWGMIKTVFVVRGDRKRRATALNARYSKVHNSACVMGAHLHGVYRDLPVPPVAAHAPARSYRCHIVRGPARGSSRSRRSSLSSAFEIPTAAMRVLEWWAATRETDAFGRIVGRRGDNCLRAEQVMMGSCGRQ